MGVCLILCNTSLLSQVNSFLFPSCCNTSGNNDYVDIIMCILSIDTEYRQLNIIMYIKRLFYFKMIANKEEQ